MEIRWHSRHNRKTYIEGTEATWYQTVPHKTSGNQKGSVMLVLGLEGQVLANITGKAWLPTYNDKHVQSTA